ncbi:vacuolar protein sorting-associated protein 37A-like isoform X2 [Mytilus edulis]|uniref:vacuolar protein sorting-associated protein 37A-like isoform X2 n=1 Tax=Mytilus edulis TaxID=6550 RepID=UPI0039EDFBD9
MNWLIGNKSKSTAQSQTNLQAHRTKQIDSLKKANLNPSEIIPNTEYRVTFRCGNNNITLVITLPPQFPQDPPTVTVEPLVNHPWVDTQGKLIGCPSLSSFTMHSSLGQITQSIIEEFRRSPPSLVSQGFNPGAPMQYPQPGPQPGAQGGPPGYPMYGGYNPYTSPSLPPQTVTAPTIPSSSSGPSVPDDELRVPDVFAAFPELKTKSLTELNGLLNEEDKILEMIQKMSEVSKMKEDREKLSNECIELAKENLSKKPKIQQMRQWVGEKNQLFERSREEFERDQEKLMSLSDTFHPTNIQTNMKVALMEAEEESEKIVDDFLNKKMEIDEFTQKFLQIRMQSHCRRAKEEKLNQLIHQSRY